MEALPRVKSIGLHRSFSISPDSRPLLLLCWWGAVVYCSLNTKTGSQGNPGNSHVPKPFFALGSVTSGPSSGGAIRRLQGKVRVGPGMYFLYVPKNLQRRRFFAALWVDDSMASQNRSLSTPFAGNLLTLSDPLTHIDRRHPNALGRWNLSRDPDAWSKQGRACPGSVALKLGDLEINLAHESP